MRKVIPYGKQSITDDDILAVTDVLKSDFLTQGPAVTEFEKNYAAKMNVPFACAVSSATAALHIAYQALGLGVDDILWSVPNTFVATTNAALYLGAKVDFVDIDPLTFCMSAEQLEIKLKNAKQSGTLPKIVVPVHFGGLSCDMKAIHKLSLEYSFKIVEDASHCVGAEYDKAPVGDCRYSDLCVFSFHPVKIITTGEGGMITSQNKDLYEKVMMARTHGITKDPATMVASSPAPWEMEQHFLGFNYRMTDIQAALGNSQLKRLDSNIARRRAIASIYQEAFKNLPIQVQAPLENAQSSWHLFPVLFESSDMRRHAYDTLKTKNIFTQVHYIPVHTQPYYKNMGFKLGDFPMAEDYYSRCLSLPMYHGLTDDEQDFIISAIRTLF